MPVVLVETPGDTGYLYQGYYYGDVEFPIDPGVSRRSIDSWTSAPDVNTMDGKTAARESTSSPSRCVDGTGIANQAHVVAAGLRRRGFVIHGVGTATPFGVREETVVYHANNSAASLGRGPGGHPHDRRAGGDGARSHDGGRDVTVLTGSDVSVIAPPHKTPRRPQR